MENNDFEKFMKEMNNENLYSILRISKEADPIEMRAAFKKVVKECHPDKVSDNLKEEAAKRFQKIQKVYNFLKNHLNREQYNKHLGQIEERKVRTHKMNAERKKFQEDLVKRENEGKDNNSNEDKRSEETIHREKHKKRRKDSFQDNKIHIEDFNQSNNDIIYNKLKRKNEKLKESGIRIKWHKDSMFSFNKETIFEYFIEYGPILEVKLNIDKREAFILYETNISIIKLFEKQDKNLFSMFKMERYKPEEKKEGLDDIHKIRTSYLDTNIINMMKNQKLKENTEFLQNKRVFSDTPLEKLKFSTDEKMKQEDKHNSFNESKKLTLEELEKIVSSKILN